MVDDIGGRRGTDGPGPADRRSAPRVAVAPGPSGPRGRRGRIAEAVAARYLRARGWTVLGRNVRVGRDEIDLVALQPGPTPTLVLVEVRSRSGSRFGAPQESVDGPKVSRLSRASSPLRHGPALPGSPSWPRHWRVALVCLTRTREG